MLSAEGRAFSVRFFSCPLIDFGSIASAETPSFWRPSCFCFSSCKQYMRSGLAPCPAYQTGWYDACTLSCGGSIILIGETASGGHFPIRTSTALGLCRVREAAYFAQSSSLELIEQIWAPAVLMVRKRDYGPWTLPSFVLPPEVDITKIGKGANGKRTLLLPCKL